MKSLGGRRRRFYNKGPLTAREKRQGKNAVIQMLGADVFKITVLKLHQAFNSNGQSVKIVLLLHDGIWFTCPDKPRDCRACHRDYPQGDGEFREIFCSSQGGAGLTPKIRLAVSPACLLIRCLRCLFERIRAREALPVPVIDRPVTKPSCDPAADPGQVSLPMGNRKGAVKTLLLTAFSRNQNAVDARGQFANTLCPESEKRGESFSGAL